MKEYFMFFVGLALLSIFLLYNSLHTTLINYVSVKSISSQLVTQKTISSRKMDQRLELCQLNKSKLELLKINEERLRSLKSDEIQKSNNWVLKGGYWSPLYEPLNPCQPLGSVVIIIPLRDREEHLLIMLSRLHPMLRKQFQEYHIIVIEQAGEEMFNRASLMNVGFLEAARDTLADCFIFHDVDLYPENDLNIYSCINAPIHFSCSVSTHSYKLKYDTLIGGVTGITRNQFLKVNGFSNLYWGWGGEDDDMFKRTLTTDSYRVWAVYSESMLRFAPSHQDFVLSDRLTKYFTIHRPNSTIGRYTMLKHTQRKSTRSDVLNALLKSAKERMMYDGLCSIKYEVLSDVKFHLYRRIKVQFDAPSNSHELINITKESFWKLKNVRSSRDAVIP